MFDSSIITIISINSTNEDLRCKITRIERQRSVRAAFRTRIFVFLFLQRPNIYLSRTCFKCNNFRGGFQATWVKRHSRSDAFTSRSDDHTSLTSTLATIYSTITHRFDALDARSHARFIFRWIKDAKDVAISISSDTSITRRDMIEDRREIRRVSTSREVHVIAFFCAKIYIYIYIFYFLCILFVARIQKWRIILEIVYNGNEPYAIGN